MSGSAGERVAVVTASACNLPVLAYSIIVGMTSKLTCIRSTNRSVTVLEIFKKRRIARVRCSDIEERISVWRCPHDRIGADIGARARPVLDDEWLA
jgi:hypothetical protein